MSVIVRPTPLGTEHRLQPTEKVVEIDRCGPGSSQLDGERKAIDPFADLLNDILPVLINRKSAVSSIRLAGEEFRSELSGFERPESDDVFSSEIKREPRRRQDRDGGDGEQRIDDLDNWLNEVFAIVEDEEELASPAQYCAEIGCRWRVLGEADRPGDRAHHVASDTKRGKLDE